LQNVFHEKDTTFNGNAGVITGVTSWDLYPDSIRTWHGRLLFVREEDGIAQYEFSAGAVPYLISLFKGGVADTLNFSDRMLQIGLPLSPGKSWKIRPTDDPWGNGSLEKEYLGKETLSFDGKSYECGVFVLHGLGDTPIKTWVSSLGVLRATIDYGELFLSEEPSPATYAWETYELLRANAGDASIDSLKQRYRLLTTETFAD
jgi:hypothetical protein